MIIQITRICYEYQIKVCRLNEMTNRVDLNIVHLFLGFLKQIETIHIKGFLVLKLIKEKINCLYNKYLRILLKVSNPKH